MGANWTLTSMGAKQNITLDCDLANSVLIDSVNEFGKSHVGVAITSPKQFMNPKLKK